MSTSPFDLGVTSAADDSERLVKALAAVLGPADVLVDPADLAFYSSDIYGEGVLAELVIRPSTVEAVCRAVRICTDLGRFVVPRGGGLSYTAGYLPTRAHTVIVDLGRLDRILEINAEDMYVTVEAGVTWKQLYEALRSHGVRTPYFGPMSGYSSTVGGALSQGSVFLGSTQYGTSAESALGLEVVLPSGELLRTGSAASVAATSPFFRTYGPDLTGLFLGDTGALGFKVRMTLRLVRVPAHSRYASFSFEGYEPQLRALAEISRLGLASECFGSDPFVSNQRFYDGDLAQDLGYLKGVVESGQTLLKGLKDAARIAMAGKRAAGAGAYLLNVVIDQPSEAGADAALESIRAIGTREGKELEPSVPRALRGQPFVYPNSILGGRGERWVPTNSLSPHSRAIQVMSALQAYFASHEPSIAEHGLTWGYVLLAVSNSTTLIEVLLYWPDSWRLYHERVIQPNHLARLRKLPANPAATDFARRLREGLSELFAKHGCAHLQIGKTYPYRETRDPATYRLLSALKDHLDPQRRVNPGSLGLE